MQRWKAISIDLQVPPGTHPVHHHHLDGFLASAWALEGNGIRTIVIEFNQYLSRQACWKRVALDAYNPDGAAEPVYVPAYLSKQGQQEIHRAVSSDGIPSRGVANPAA